jgi:hypothetical protein
MERNLRVTPICQKIRSLGGDMHALVDSVVFIKNDQAALGKELDPLQSR